MNELAQNLPSPKPESKLETRPEARPEARYDDEFSGLIGWGLTWARVLEIISILIAVEQFFFAIRNITLANPTENSLWQLLSSSTYVNLMFYLHQFRMKGEDYDKSNTEKALCETLSYLAPVWIGLSSVVFCTLAATFCEFVGGLFLPIGFRIPNHALTMGLAFLISALPCIGLHLVLRSENKILCRGEKFLKLINPFSVMNLPRLRFLSVFSIVGGLLCLSFGIYDLLFHISVHPWQTILTGIAIIILGSFVQWYRRSVRNSCRNPTPIYFERTLNRLNQFWLAAPVILATLFIAGFF